MPSLNNIGLGRQARSLVKPSHIFGCAILALSIATTLSAKPAAGFLTPFHATTQRSGYTIETVGDTLGQASAQNTRVIIRVAGADKKLVKPGGIALVDKAGTAIKPVFREDRKVGHEENTGLPLSMNGGAVGVDLGKVFGPHRTYAYTKVDWPRSAFTADKTLQITLTTGRTFAVPLSAIAR